MSTKRGRLQSLSGIARQPPGPSEMKNTIHGAALQGTHSSSRHRVDRRHDDRSIKSSPRCVVAFDDPQLRLGFRLYRRVIDFWRDNVKSLGGVSQLLSILDTRPLTECRTKRMGRQRKGLLEGGTASRAE